MTLLPQWSDNYSFLLHCSETGDAAIIDCPDAGPMIEKCEALGVQPTKILNTHHHPDHIMGNEDLKKHWPALRIFGFEGDKERITGITDTLKEGDTVSVGHATATVLLTNGHTIGHIAYHFADDKALFCGDTMFVAGCGRLFEGSAKQMYESLQKLGALDPQTRVYCGHEYTLSSLKFARHVEPENEDLKALQQQAEAARAKDEPTVPSTIAQEWKTNPFLRVDQPAIIEVAKGQGADVSDPAAILGAIRSLKDNFKG